MQEWISIAQKWLSLACASVLFVAALCSVVLAFCHPTGPRAWVFIIATVCVLAGSYWICSDLAELTDETRATGEG
jgi:putative flippase GtrA